MVFRDSVYVSRPYFESMTQVEGLYLATTNEYLNGRFLYFTQTIEGNAQTPTRQQEVRLDLERLLKSGPETDYYSLLEEV